jgi:hypothetical protein
MALNERGCMKGYSFDDKLELLGVLAGAFLVIMGLVTVASVPWATIENTAAALLQVLGILIVFAIAFVLIAITYSGNTDELLPGGKNAE